MWGDSCIVYQKLKKSSRILENQNSQEKSNSSGSKNHLRELKAYICRNEITNLSTLAEIEIINLKNTLQKLKHTCMNWNSMLEQTYLITSSRYISFHHSKILQYYKFRITNSSSSSLPMKGECSLIYTKIKQLPH